MSKSSPAGVTGESRETGISGVSEDSGTKPKVIFFGNGPLAEAALAVIQPACEVIFYARERQDLEEVKGLKAEFPEAHGILASYGVLIKDDVLEIFEPEGILNIHPSLLPLYRGASPIETAILNGDTKFGVSVMKLAHAMDAGPIYYQEKVAFDKSASKSEIYNELAITGAKWLVSHLNSLPEPQPQNDNLATYTKMLDKSMSPLDPATKTATELLNQVRAFSGYPKSKYEFFGLDCTVIAAHVAESDETAGVLCIQCHDGSKLVIDEVQPAGRRVMDVKSFINGYGKAK